MYQEILTRFKQGYRTIKFPEGPLPPLPEHLRGRPLFALDKCAPDCRLCAEVCPVAAIEPATKALDLGKCLFCTDCVQACPAGAISFSRDYRLSVRRREDLLVSVEQQEMVLAAELERRLLKLFGRSLKLRQVSAGGCNACEADVNVLSTIGWDLGRFGIQVVASPRHADGLLITGPVTRNMELALLKTWEAVAEPKVVIVVGACAIAGGPYRGLAEVGDGVQKLPVDLYIPGCPPHPLTILDGLLRLIGRIENRS
ncbi:MAG: 4Fe-4S binding protein [Deltaproteobacteria bacterium]|nr:4Fe-4S binding protein [Deltaproteobacteria bacterium]